MTNILAAAAQERTPGNVVMLGNGVAGFKDVGDRLCFRVQVRGSTLDFEQASNASYCTAALMLLVAT